MIGNIPRLFYFTLCVVVVLSCGPVMARDLFTMHPHMPENSNVEEYEWSEALVELPSFPVNDDLLEVKLKLLRSKFRFLVDQNNLVSNVEDGTIQYTLVMESERGARNVVFETMRCSTMEYKTLAFGDSKGKWRKMGRPKWLPIRRSRVNPYHHQLWRFYFCKGFPESQPDREEIIETVKFPNYRTPQGIR